MSLVCTFLKEIEKILRNNQEKKKKRKKNPKRNYISSHILSEIRGFCKRQQKKLQGKK